MWKRNDRPKEWKASKAADINSVIYTLKRVLTVVFPMVTLPYALRILGVENIGRYNFVSSVIGYFTLLASLGLWDYGKRDGAVIRRDREKFSAFASEIFSMNVMLAASVYILLGVCIFCIDRMRQEALLVIILSSSVILGILGVEWIYIVFEDYLYITIRQIVLQFVSMVLLFAFVKDRDDLMIYALVTVTESVGSSLWNLAHSRKYCDIKMTFHIPWKKHLSKAIVFFASSLMVTIYVSTDKTILGILCGDYAVGLYSVSVKVYHFVLAVVTSFLEVSRARMCDLVGNGHREIYNRETSEIYGLTLTFVMPAVVGVCIFRDEIIYILGGSEYREASVSLFILSVTMLCYVFALYWGQCVLVPNGKERTLMLIMTFSAGMNLMLNLLLIPHFKQDAAAFTTMISEGAVGLLSILYGKKLVCHAGIKEAVLKSMAGTGFVLAVSLVFKTFLGNQVVALCLSMVIGGLGFFAIEIIMKNEVILRPVRKFLSRRKSS